MFRSLNIGAKLVLSVAIAILVGIIVLISVVSVEVSSNMEEQAKSVIYQASKRYMNFIEGALNETIVSTKSTASSIDDFILREDKFNINSIENIIQNTLDSSSHASYAFFVLEANHMLEGNSIKKRYKSENGSFGMIFTDGDIVNVGGIETLQFSEKIKNLPAVKRLQAEVKHNDRDRIL
ncbi:hypothetical protein CINS5915_06920 [Campylobacter insulaenigrae]|uniref:hypothetical protein n=1 Tax=Campylobacter insulaenigrae TaxID=260714 RepID=UPI0021539056|nr:hypothetical protein [Campylobacter insulaenigrae]MCR6576093.1 hypothetical protein [Campylobacter insulaenigrae]